MIESAEKLLPHRPPMLWLSGLVACTDTSATATARFDTADYAVANGFVLESVLVECVAQAVAAAKRQRASSNSPLDRTGGGMLAAVTGFRIQSRPAAGKTLQIEVRELKRFGPMLLVTGIITCEGRTIASGELMLNG